MLSVVAQEGYEATHGFKPYAINADTKMKTLTILCSVLILNGCCFFQGPAMASRPTECIARAKDILGDKECFNKRGEPADCYMNRNK